MKFQIISHAGLLVEKDGVQLLCDPWFTGSCYWRSWWNYPPVSEEVIQSLKPDYIYLTHIHWDHFHGISLKRFPKTTPIIVPKGNFDRMKKDLNYLGFNNVTELKHGQVMELGPDFEITCYHFDFKLDSTIVIKDSNTTLLNINDCKIMGLPLKQILNEHKKIDFAFASHSSANARACYEIIDDPSYQVDNVSQYIKNFSQFVQATGARYAIPFASNICHLHDDTFKYNALGQTPGMVREYWQENGISKPELKVMVSGDSWSYEDGFKIGEKDWFTDRERLLAEYRKEKEPTFRKFKEQENKAQVTLQDMEAFFPKFMKAIPFFVRLAFRNHPIVFVLTAGDNRFIYRINLFTRKVEVLDQVPNTEQAIQIHTSAYIFKSCLSMNMFSFIGLSKRVTFRVQAKELVYAQTLDLLFGLWEYELIPLRHLFRPRSLQTWMLRWREILLYIHLTKDLVLTRKLKIEKHLIPYTRSLSLGKSCS
jgi:beta-lactamase family protein